MARPRSEEARRKALDAAAELIVESGVGALSIEEVAARSGVAKTTIYRHWPERAALIVDTVRSCVEHVATPDTGSLRGDLDAWFRAMVQADLTGRVGQLLPSVLAAARRDPEIALVMERFAGERRIPILTIVARAQARGELPRDLDPEVVIGTIIGPIVFRKTVLGQQVEPAYRDACLDVAIAGLRATGSSTGRHRLPVESVQPASGRR